MNRNPEITPEVIANRKRFIDALINEDPTGQCAGQMFDRSVSGDKHYRCALGVAAALFLDIHNQAEYRAYCHRYPVAGKPYDELEKILGLKDAQEVYRLNDTDEGEGMRPFPEIAKKLATIWKLGK